MWYHQLRVRRPRQRSSGELGLPEAPRGLRRLQGLTAGQAAKQGTVPFQSSGIYSAGAERSSVNVSSAQVSVLSCLLSTEMERWDKYTGLHKLPSIC